MALHKIMAVWHLVLVSHQSLDVVQTKGPVNSAFHVSNPGAGVVVDTVSSQQLGQAAGSYASSS